MQPAHSPRPTPQDAPAERSIRYEDWKMRIHTATEIDQLLAIVRAYIAQWRPDQLAALPLEAGFGFLRCSEDVALRAVVAAQAELRMHPDHPDAALLREMSLTMMAAASRLRLLDALRRTEAVR